MSDFVKAFSFLQTALKEDWARGLMATMGFNQLVPASAEVQSAALGLPSSSKPSPLPAAAAPVIPVATPAAVTAEATPSVKMSCPPEPVATAPPAPEPVASAPKLAASAPSAPGPVTAPPAREPVATAPTAPVPDPTQPETEVAVDDVNSSTHRAAHARLTRKMAAVGEDFPNANKLWNGSRQEH